MTTGEPKGDSHMDEKTLLSVVSKLHHTAIRESQVVGPKQDYYVTVEQLEQAFLDGALPLGSYNCPICGKDNPHFHKESLSAIPDIEREWSIKSQRLGEAFNRLWDERGFGPESFIDKLAVWDVIGDLLADYPERR
jgi:hypothetical protein